MTNGLASRDYALKPAPIHYLNLGRLLERIVRSWGADHVKISAIPPAPDADLSLERAVVLTGTLNGVLVVRCAPPFAQWLRFQRQGSALGQYPAEEIFEELAGLFCLYLFHDFWNPASFQIGPLQPFPSSPRNWPSFPTHAACAVEVEGYEVELRLWLRD